MFRTDDEGSYVRANRWLPLEVVSHLASNAVAAMGAAGRMQVSVDLLIVGTQTVAADASAQRGHLRGMAEMTQNSADRSRILARS